jgi:tRNA (guanine26-N2/guanine27-N2)-dimethyltransferase
MNITKKLEYITEGETKVLVYKNKKFNKGPGYKNYLPFYNPTMELNRDFSIIIAQSLLNNNIQHLDFLDGFGASGIRGLRFANELIGDFNININDWSEESYNLIKKNIIISKLNNVIAFNKNINVLLSEQKFDYIDIDPYGSPVYYIDSALRSIKNYGIIACTATDTATLCGVYPKVCQRRYFANPYHSPIMHEVGLRILIGYICRESAKFDKGIEILSSYSVDHYFRIYLKILNGINYANKSISKVVSIDSENLPHNTKNKLKVGPLWIGKIQNKNKISDFRTILFKKNIKTKIKLLKLLDLLEEEAEGEPFFYTTDKLASELKILPPSIREVFLKIENSGYNSCRTHFHPMGFKTNAPKDIIKKIFND